MDGGIKMIDPRIFKREEDWYNAGYEYAFRCGCERAYVVINHKTKDALIMVDHGNGGCHFENYYPPRMREENAPIYKVITLSIREGERLPSHEMFGWYYRVYDAYKAVETNACDMQDHAFNYALVSASYEGGYGLRDEELQWYKWNYTDEKWETCERPDACDGLMFV